MSIADVLNEYAAFTFGNRNEEPAKVDLAEIARLTGDIQKQMAARFAGIPVIVDDELKGVEYKIHVSRELHELILKESAEMAI